MTLYWWNSRGRVWRRIIKGDNYVCGTEVSLVIWLTVLVSTKLKFKKNSIQEIVSCGHIDYQINELVQINIYNDNLKSMYIWKKNTQLCLYVISLCWILQCLHNCRGWRLNQQIFKLIRPQCLPENDQDCNIKRQVWKNPRQKMVRYLIK